MKILLFMTMVLTLVISGGTHCEVVNKKFLCDINGDAVSIFASKHNYPVYLNSGQLNDYNIKGKNIECFYSDTGSECLMDINKKKYHIYSKLPEVIGRSALVGILNALEKSIIQSESKKSENIGVNNVKIDHGYDRHGSDYRWFIIDTADPHLCFEQCEKEARCRAWTYVSPGIQGRRPRCWLKSSVPQKIPHRGMISGVKVSSTSQTGARKGDTSHTREFVLENPSLAESWFKGWSVLSLPRDTQGKTGKIFASEKRFGWFSPARDVGDALPPKGGHGAVLYLHPTSQKEPAVLKKRVYSNGQQQLFIRVAGNRNGDFRLVVRVDGRKIFSRVIDGKKWYEFHIPIDKKGSLDLEVDIEANGWYYEYAFIDTIRLVSPMIHADPESMLAGEKKYGHENSSVPKNKPQDTGNHPSSTTNIPGCDRVGMECGYDRPGSDYRWFKMDTADPDICRQTCEWEARCKAWTYVSPGIQGKRARCWLKSSLPRRIRRQGMVSGVKKKQKGSPKSGKERSKQIGTGEGSSSGILVDTQEMLHEVAYDTDRPGGDYRFFVPRIYSSCSQMCPINRPCRIVCEPPVFTECQKACEKDRRCRAWSYTPAGIQGRKAFCRLKKSVPPSRHAAHIVSGVVRGEETLHKKSTTDTPAGSADSRKKSLGVRGTAKTGFHLPQRCRPLFQKYLASAGFLMQSVGREDASDDFVLQQLKAYRNNLKALRKCTPSFSPTLSAAEGNNKNVGRCGKEYREYLHAYRSVEKRMIQGPQQEFIDARRRYLYAKKSYDQCLSVPGKPRVELPTEKKHPKVIPNKDRKASGPRIVGVTIARKALSREKPDPGTVTDRLPAGIHRFYIFVDYEGFSPSNRVDLLWYLRPAGEREERLLFQENGGHLPKRRGVFSAPVAIEGGVLPNGAYRIVFRIDGRNSFEKHFTIGE